MVEVLLVLEIFLTEDSWVEDLLCGAPSCSETCLFITDDLLVASICSAWSLAWLYFGDWWGWSFGSSGTAAGCFSWEVWWLRTGSTGLAILLFARSCCRLSWEPWLRPLHLLGPVLLGCCQPLIRIISGLKTNFNPSLSYSAHNSRHANSNISTAQLKHLTLKTHTHTHKNNKETHKIYTESQYF